MLLPKPLPRTNRAVGFRNPKLLSLPRLVRERALLRRQRAVVVLTNGCFDLLHPGHIYFLQKARRLGDCLIVALNSDSSVRALKGPTRPVQDERERAFALAALSCVDYVVLFRSPRLVREINAIRPDIYSKAGDYALDKLHAAEREALEAGAVRIRFLPLLKGYSTSKLIQKLVAANGAV